MSDLRLIGVAGGIGSGKTTVAKMFEQFGIPSVNFDKIWKSKNGMTNLLTLYWD